uniref:RB1-inducible coiled-coil protein 1 n=1 Tax=Corethrella appendiculata TaxID=1370023 RepID=W4VRG4_9DIPT
MMYVFHVDTGHMMTFEMHMGLESVSNLKAEIEKKLSIPASSVVLLVSGGDMLQNNQRVCGYAAGTDTNPIYMFSTTIVDINNQPPPWPSIDTDTDLRAQVDRCLELPATYSTVVARATLAQDIYNMAKEELKVCEELVHEQHLQQQGWAAVVANMEDITEEFKIRCDNFRKVFEEHLERRDEYIEFTNEFNNDLDKLSKIPILTGLLNSAELKPCSAFDDVYSDNDSFSKSKGANAATTTSGSSEKNQSTSTTATTTPAVLPLPPTTTTATTSDSAATTSSAASKDISDDAKDKATLLEWISGPETQKSLRRMAETCSQGLESFDRDTMDNLNKDIQKAIDAAQREDMKEIKGLEDRLYGLEKLMSDAKKSVQEQGELAQAFQQNQNRANKLGDASILPDLCASHRSQLVVMLQNHKLLRDIRRRCSKAKDELGGNLYQRLKFVIHVENRMCEIDNTLLFYLRCLRRMQKHLYIIEQIHHSPNMYATAVTEVVRRRMFSTGFLTWAYNLACQLLTIYNNEVTRRHEFSALFDGHFLSSLFPGMDDMPSNYATEPPPHYDTNLPALLKEDIKLLSTCLPELTPKTEVPDLDSVINFFSSKSVYKSNNSLTNKQIIDVEETNKTAEQLESDGNLLRPSTVHILKEYERGCESETDTEEFEKVGPSSIDKRMQLKIKDKANNLPKVEVCNMSTSMETIEKVDSETLTEENLGTTRLEVERLKTILITMFNLSNTKLNELKNELDNFKTNTKTSKFEFDNKMKILNDSWTSMQNEIQIREREIIQRLTVDHELEMNDLRKSISSKDEEIQSLRSDNSTIKASHIETVSNYENEKKQITDEIELLKSQHKDLEKKITDANVDKEKTVSEALEKLEHKHKTEMESLRCRFKLMTSMDRSPSDTSLEKIERPDMIDIASHENILMLAKQNFNREKELAIKAAIDAERSKSTTASSSLLAATLIPTAPTAKVESSSISSSSPKSPSSSQDIYKRIMEEKERQIDTLREREQHLVKENQKYKERIQSLIDSDITTDSLSMLKNKIESLEKDRERLEKELDKEKQKRSKMVSSVLSSSTVSSSQPKGAGNSSCLNLNSCSKGDTVVIVWNSAHEQYIIVQNNPVFYFLHAESYAGLNLTPPTPNTMPTIVHSVGVVVDKEYCHARKDENRYKVSRGTKFFRVKVRPPTKPCETEKCSHKKDKNKDSDVISRSISSEKFHSTSPGLIDSFAQTESVMPILEDTTIKSTTSSTSHDMIDSGVVEQQKSVYKERNISVDDDSASLINDDDNTRYKSVSEEEQQDTQEDEVKSNELDEPTNIISSKNDADSSDEYRSLETKEDDCDDDDEDDIDNNVLNYML